MTDVREWFLNWQIYNGTQEDADAATEMLFRERNNIPYHVCGNKIANGKYFECQERHHAKAEAWKWKRNPMKEME